MKEWWLAAMILVTGVAGVVGGLLLVARPDGSLLHADTSALADSPFRDWRVPGLLLTLLVGGGYLLTGFANLRRWHHAGRLSMFAGVGLVCFEIAELAWLGFQPLEGVFATVGLVVAILAAWSLVEVRDADVSAVADGIG